MMRISRFSHVFLGIRNPERRRSLETAKKAAEACAALWRNPVDRITSYGIRVNAGFIIGSSMGEKDGSRPADR